MTSFVSRRIQVVGVLRRGYKNWLHIVLRYVLARNKPVSLQIFDGRTVQGVMIGDISNVIALPTLLKSGWNIKRIDESRSSLEREDGTLMICRLDSGADIAHLATIFVEEAYKADLQDKVVIDVGASNGDSAVYFIRKGASRVIALEPSENSFKLAVENIKVNDPEKRITLLNAALSAKSGHSEFYLSSRSPNANTLMLTDLTRRINEFDGKADVVTTSLEDLLEQEKLGHIDFLKIDCEGCEYELVRSLTAGVMKKIEEIMLEFHEGKKDLPEILAKQGFDVTTSEGSAPLGYLHAFRHSEHGSTSTKAGS